LGTGGIAIALLPAARQRLVPDLSPAGDVAVAVAVVVAIGALARLRAAGFGRPVIPGVADVTFTDRVRQAIEGVAIAAGIAAPLVRVVGHARPTAFTILRGAEPVVTFTTGLIGLLPAAELEAVAAHEAAHVASQAVEETRTLETMLDALRLSGTAALWLFLITRPTWLNLLVIALMVVAGLAVLRVLSGREQEDVAHVPARVVDGLVLMFNPPLVAVNLLAQTLYSVIGQDEDLLADLRGVEFTRNPEALHGALRRIRDAAVSGPPMPVGDHYRYFTAEGVLPDDFPAAQAPIAARLAMLERIDPTLVASRSLRSPAAACPDCAAPLLTRTIASHYGAPIPVDECPACGGIWFDDLELYMAGADGLIAARAHARAGTAGAPVVCPRCRVVLSRASTLGMPADVAIWECGICKGAWVRADDLVRFGRHREARQRRRSSAPRRAV
jgi:Zn-dependent protease with chaperone function/Zn-finger nucleic acid-binding protein